MLMVDEDQHLTEQAQDLLEIIQAAAGGWLRRSDIARIQEKARLNVWDVKLLDRLQDAGLIEIQRRPFPGAVGYVWAYRAK